jgi:hypothetical protein
MNAIALRLRQLTLAAFLVALLVPVAASTARAEGGTCASPAHFTFVVGLPPGLPGLPATGVITTTECFNAPTAGAVVATGTFVVTAGGVTIGAGTLIAFHYGCAVLAFFEGTALNHEFNGTLTFSCVAGTTTGSGTTVVHFEDIGTISVSFACTGVGTASYSCAPTGPPTFVPSVGRDD